MTWHGRSERQRGRREATLAARRYAKEARRFLDEAFSMSMPFPEQSGEGEPPSMPNHPQTEEGWIVFQGFRSGAIQYHRGDPLSLEQGLALRRELQDSYLRRAALPPGWRPVQRVAPPPITASYDTPPPPDWVTHLATNTLPTSWCWKLAEALVALDKPISVSIDLVPRDLVAHATSEYGLLPKPNMGSAVRRSVAHLNEYLTVLIGRVRQQTTEAA